MVGLLIGLLAIGVAIATMLASRSAAGSVSEISALQQQASFAMRVIGMQLRQAGAMGLDQTTPGFATYGFVPYDAVASTGQRVGGTDGTGGAPDEVIVSFGQDGKMLPGAGAALRDCLADKIDLGKSAENRFFVQGGSLNCATAHGSEPIITNVADFQISYRVQTTTGLATTSTQVMNADGVQAAALWGAVNAIEVCLDLQGTDSTPDAAGEYFDCAFVKRKLNNRVHLVYRNVFMLRAQGMPS